MAATAAVPAQAAVPMFAPYNMDDEGAALADAAPRCRLGFVVACTGIIWCDNTAWLDRFPGPGAVGARTCDSNVTAVVGPVLLVLLAPVVVEGAGPNEVENVVVEGVLDTCTDDDTDTPIGCGGARDSFRFSDVISAC